MSDYIIVSTLHLRIPKGSAHAQPGVMDALLVFPTPENGILASITYSDFASKVWGVRKALQAASGGVAPPSSGAEFARILAYGVWNQSQ